jgi:hypothetical protein
MNATNPQQPGQSQPTAPFGGYPQQPGAPTVPYGAPPQTSFAPPKKPSRGKKWLTHGSVGFIALFLGVGIGSSDDEARAKDSAGPTPRATVTKEVKVEVPGPTVTATRTAAAPKPAEPPKPKGAPTTVPGDGEYLVGEDMQAGTYKTAGTDGFGCYWERAKNASGEFDAIIANGNLQGTGRVTVNKGEVFKVTGCKEWKKTG